MPRAFELYIDNAMPSEQRDALLETMRDAEATVRPVTVRGVPPEWIAFLVTFVAIADGVGTVASATNDVIDLVEKINTWRKNGKNSKTRAQLHRPGQEPLDLATATDQQVLAWLLEDTPQ